MTLHSNQSSFPPSDPGGAAIVAASCNIQSPTEGEINDLSAPERRRLIHKQQAHGQEERTPPPRVKPCCSVDLITHTLPPAHLAFISFCEEEMLNRRIFRGHDGDEPTVEASLCFPLVFTAA